MTKRRQPSSTGDGKRAKAETGEDNLLVDKVDVLIKELAAAKTPRIIIMIAVLVVCSGRVPYERTLRSVKLFAGGGAVTRAMQRHQLEAAAVDVQYGQPHDLSSAAGMAPDTRRFLVPMQKAGV